MNHTAKERNEGGIRFSVIELQNSLPTRLNHSLRVLRRSRRILLTRHDHEATLVESTCENTAFQSKFLIQETRSNCSEIVNLSTPLQLSRVCFLLTRAVQSNRDPDFLRVNMSRFIRLWPSVACAFLVGADDGVKSKVVQGEELEWRYVATASEAGFSPQMKLVALDQVPPEDVTVDVPATGAARFAQIRYGSFDSRRVALMVVPSDSGADLFVDSNHDRRLSEREQVKDASSEWTIPIDAEFVDGNAIATDKRRVRLRYAKDKLSIGTIGYVEGQIDFEGLRVAVRRVDCNGNGQFADPTDLVWMDMNGDDRWDAFAERFPFTPFFRLNGTAYTSATDLRGQRFSLSKIEATGSLQLQISDAFRERGLVKLGVVMAGRAGSIIHLDQDSAAVEVPVDDYRPVSLIVTFEPAAPPNVWTFEFVSRGADENTEWGRVSKNSISAVNPLSGLTFGCVLNREDSTYSPGTRIVMQPTLETANGLRIQSVYFGRDASRSAGEPRAQMKVVDTSGRSIGRTTSGFT